MFLVIIVRFQREIPVIPRAEITDKCFPRFKSTRIVFQRRKHQALFIRLFFFLSQILPDGVVLQRSRPRGSNWNQSPASLVVSHIFHWRLYEVKKGKKESYPRPRRFDFYRHFPRVHRRPRVVCYFTRERPPRPSVDANVHTFRTARRPLAIVFFSNVCLSDLDWSSLRAPPSNESVKQLLRRDMFRTVFYASHA